MKLEAQIENESEEIRNFILSYGSVFQFIEFLEFVGQLDGFLCLRIKGKLICILPLVKTTKNRLKAYHIPPYSHLSGPIIDFEHINDYAEIVEALLEKLPKSGHYDFKSYMIEGDVTPWLANGFSISAGQTFIVPKDIEYDFKTIHSSKRRYLKKLNSLLEKGQLVLKEGEECLDDLFRLQKVTGDRANFQTHADTIKRIMNDLPNNSKYSLVLYDEKMNPLSGAFCPYDNQRAYHLVNASRRSEDKLLDRSNILCTYLAVKKAIEMGKSFDFEGSSIPGVANFYRMMGGQPVIIHRAQKSRSYYYYLLRMGKSFITEFK